MKVDNVTTAMCSLDTTGGCLMVYNAYKDLSNNYGSLNKSYADLNKNYTDLSKNYTDLSKNYIDLNVKYGIEQKRHDGYSILYENVKNQNEAIEEEQKVKVGDFSADNQKAVYQSDKTFTLHTVNFYLFFIYYLFALGTILLLFMSSSEKIKSWNMYFKVFFIIIIFTFPFFFEWAEDSLMDLVRYIWSLMFSNVYERRDY